MLVTEFLSPFGRLERSWLLTAWGILPAVQFPFWLRLIRAVRNARAPREPFSRIEIVLNVSVAVLVVDTGVVGRLSARNTWDSMGYHLSWVVHWKHNGDTPGIYAATRTSPSAPFDAPTRVQAITGFVEAATFSPDERMIYYPKRENGRFVLDREAYDWRLVKVI